MYCIGTSFNQAERESPQIYYRLLVHFHLPSCHFRNLYYYQFIGRSFIIGI